MTPTIEEVRKVAISYGLIVGSGNIHELQAFAQHYIEVSRKEQRESDAKICDDLYELLGKYDGSSAGICGDEIRNNTGE